MNKGISTIVGIGTLAVSGLVQANSGISLDELIEAGESISRIQDTIDGGQASLDEPSGTITLNDGSRMVISTPDGTTSLRDALRNDSATLHYNGTPVFVSTSASALDNVYDSDAVASFTMSSAVEGRPVVLNWTGQLSDITNSSTFDATVNGRPVTLILPEGKALNDFNGSMPVTMLDEDGNVLFEDRTLNSLTFDEAAELAGELGILDADRLLRGAQKQAMAQNFNPIVRQVDQAMFPFEDGQYGRADGVNVWASAGVSNIDGEAVSFGYDGDSKSAMLGVDYKVNNVLVGIAAGRNEIRLDSAYGGDFDFGGELIAPYGAVSFLDGNLVFDAIVTYQDVDGDQHNDYFIEPLELEGDRWGVRGSGTWFLPEFSSIKAGLTLGGTYMKDDIEGTYLGTTADNYGVELGEVFGGVKFGSEFGTGRVYGSLLYHHDVTSEVDSNIDYLDDDEDGRTVFEIGAAHRLGRNMDVNIGAKTVVGNSDTEYDTIYTSLNYSF